MFCFVYSLLLYLGNWNLSFDFLQNSSKKLGGSLTFQFWIFCNLRSKISTHEYIQFITEAYYKILFTDLNLHGVYLSFTGAYKKILSYYCLWTIISGSALSIMYYKFLNMNIFLCIIFCNWFRLVICRSKRSQIHFRELRFNLMWKAK